jgi:hypothetical protein
MQCVVVENVKKKRPGVKKIDISCHEIRHILFETAALKTKPLVKIATYR